MTEEALVEAFGLADETGYVLVATADAEGRPHVSVAGRMERRSGLEVEVSAWFCPGTLENVTENAHVTLVAWDPAFDRGYQLLGRVTAVEETGVMDGYWPEEEETGELPQVERRLVVRVERVLTFTAAPHTDRAV